MLHDNDFLKIRVRRVQLRPFPWFKVADYYLIEQVDREWYDPTYGNSAFVGDYIYFWKTIAKYKCSKYSLEQVEAISKEMANK